MLSFLSKIPIIYLDTCDWKEKQHLFTFNSVEPAREAITTATLLGMLPTSPCMTASGIFPIRLGKDMELLSRILNRYRIPQFNFPSRLRVFSIGFISDLWAI